MQIQDCIQSQKEPSNLVSYIKDRHPFDRCNYKDGKTYDYTTLDGFDSANFNIKNDSQ